MLKRMFQYKWYLLVVLLLIIADPSLNSILNFLLQRMFNTATPGGDRIELLRLLSAGFLLWMLKRVITYANGVVKARYICNAKRDIKHQIFSRMMQLDTTNIAEISSSGEYISIFTNDVTLLETRFFDQLLNLVGGIFSIVILGTSFIALNAKLAVPILSFGFFATLVPIVFSKKLNEKSLYYSNSISKFTQKVKEYMVAYPTIKNYSIENEISSRFDIENNNAEDAKFDADCTLALADSVGQLLGWFMRLIGVGLGLVYVIKGEILIGTVIATQSFANDLAGPLNSIVMNVNSIRSVRAIVKKMEKMASAGNQVATSDSPANKLEEKNSRTNPDSFDIEFRDFSLTLGQKEIINNFSFRFETNKKYLVIGLNGSGKSTLFKSLKKWYGFSGDRITLNDVPIDRISNNDMSNYVSYLNESVSLFSGSVKENITLFRDFNSDVFEEAISRAHVELEMDRDINDDGRNISSGEQRRIEIARSLLSSVKVIVFDEVVSTLDIETAYEIEKMALGLRDKTVIFISHNFSGKLIREYDEILVIQDGLLLDHGPFDKLIKSCDYFKRACQIKFGDFA